MAGKYESRNEEGAHRILDDDPKALRLLKEQHQIFRALFDRAEDAKGTELVVVAREACMRLTVHMTIEEEIFYPAVKTVGEAEEVNEGVVEHGSAKVMIAELEQLDGTEELYKSKVHVLGEETMHHVDEEDEEMFADARAAHDRGELDLEALGEEMEARQRELYDRILADGDVGETGEVDMEEIPSA